MKIPARYNLIIPSVILIFLTTLSCNRGVESNHELSIMSPDSMPVMAQNEPVFIYNIPADSFDMIQGQIRRDSFLSDLLLKNGVSLPEIDRVLNNSKEVFDVRKILPGKNYSILLDRDSIPRAKYMIYEHDPAITYVFSFNDSLNITAFRKEVTTEIKYARGTITTSLWQSIMDGGMPPKLAVELADIFQWTVDFFGLEEGDNFKVVYEEKFIEGKSMDIGKILTAQFTSSGVTYSAIPFLQEGQQSFFDSDGKSLRKAFLKAPLTFNRISSRYTTSRFHPILKIRRPHLGVDYAAPVGTEVHTIGDGKVVSVTSGGGEGRMVKIKHNSQYSTAYMHLSRFGPGIAPGVMVRQGQVIGYVGSSGLSTGPHLDFRFYMNGSPIDPLRVIAPPSEPIAQSSLEKFQKIKQVNLDLLSTF